MPRGAPTMVTPVMGMVILVIVLLAANGPRQCESLEDYDDEEYRVGCHPEEADSCFNDVNQNLICNLGRSGTRNCKNRNATDLCESMRDALDCCEDIMDTCSEGDGLDTFDVWLSGLWGVYTHLCVEDEELLLISDLLQGSNCFRLKKFISCVEDRAQLTHVADLLTTDLDLHECNQLQVAVAACIEDSEKNRGRCRGKGQAINEALIVFFSTTACGHAPPLPPTPSPQPCMPPTASESGQETPNTAQQDSTTSNNSTSNENSSSASKNSTKSTTTVPATTTTTITSTTSYTQGDTSLGSSTSRASNTTTNQGTSSTWEPPSSTSKAQACKQTQQEEVTSSSSGKSTASTIVVTVLVTLVMAGLVVMVLVKRGVLVIRTNFDRRLIGGGNNDEESNGAYDRF